MSEKSQYTSSKAFVAGLASGSIAIGVALLLRSFIGFPFIPELASQTLFSITPGAIKSQAVENFGPLAKYSAFIASIVINFVLYGIFGIIAKTFIIDLTSSVSVTAVSLILPQILFGFIYSVILSGIKPKLGEQIGPTSDNIRKDNSRMAFLRLVTVSAIAIPIFYFGLNRLFSGQQQEQEQEQGSTPPTTQFISPARSRPAGFEDPMLTTLLNSELTPTYIFYRIDINPIVPIVDEKTWSLSVKGLVDNPLTISYEELKKMPSVEQYATLECVSNKIGGDLISTALWKGNS